MNEEQLKVLTKIRNAVDDLYDKLGVELYKKNSAAKVSYEKVNPTDLVEENLGYIVKNLNKLKNEEL